MAYHRRIDDIDVLIVGAGAAGLAAAGYLTRAGITVRLIEARERVGGRIYTAHRAAPIPVELGAEFIHGIPDETWRIVTQAGLTAYKVSDQHAYLRDSSLVELTDFWEILSKVFARLEKDSPSDRSFADFLRAHYKDFSTRELTLAKHFVDGFHAADPGKISEKALAHENEVAERLQEECVFRLMEGQDKLVTALQSELPDRDESIFFNCVAQEIKWSRHVVEITAKSLADGSLLLFRGKAAIVTVPLGVLKASLGQEGAIRFSPQLPEKQAALSKLETGGVHKLTLMFKNTFWEEYESVQGVTFFHAPHEAFPTWWTPRPLRVPLLTAWAGGEHSTRLNGIERQELYKIALTSLSHIFGIQRSRLENEIVAFLFHDWNADPYSRGAYSYIAVGGCDAQLELATPVSETLYFAGEATDFNSGGATVDAAINSGYRAANQALHGLAQLDSKDTLAI